MTGRVVAATVEVTGRVTSASAPITGLWLSPPAIGPTAVVTGPVTGRVASATGPSTGRVASASWPSGAGPDAPAAGVPPGVVAESVDGRFGRVQAGPACGFVGAAAPCRAEPAEHVELATCAVRVAFPWCEPAACRSHVSSPAAVPPEVWLSPAVRLCSVEPTACVVAGSRPAWQLDAAALSSCAGDALATWLPRNQAAPAAPARTRARRPYRRARERRAVAGAEQRWSRSPPRVRSLIYAAPFMAFMAFVPVEIMPEKQRVRNRLCKSRHDL
ncbi:hypothetical protein [Actinocatenispora thailandica]|uniref:hypothetical protein n=1 Tax=Actinocatenispora thailandica TaxID=227318 RepID=UPI001950D085|nr:hypothetical protein [Actinocatenispora thailandica]